MKTHNIYRRLRRVLPELTLPQFADMLSHDILKVSIRLSQPKLFHQVTRILYKHDPEGIYLGGADEYDNEAARIIVNLGTCKGVGSIKKLVTKTFEDSFGYASEPEKFNDVAMDIARVIHKEHLQVGLI
jgi:hypothetical protein